MSERRRYRIALVGPTHPFRGGIAHYTTLLCRALRSRHDVGFFSLSRQYPRLLFPGKTQLDASDSPFQVENEAVLDSINPVSWLGTARRIRRYAPDLLLFSWWHPFFAPAFGTVARLARRGGIPACYLCHNAVPHERSLVDSLLLRYAFSSGRVFIAHSQQDHDDLQRLRPAAIVHQSPHPTYAIFSGDDQLTDAEARSELGLDPDRRVLLFFGYIRTYKGLDDLLAAMEELPAAEGYHLLVVGEFYDDPGRYRDRLDALAARGQLTLVDRYVANEEVPRYFRAADLLVAPYHSATQSGVIQIAYGFLKPVVATAVGGIPEVVSEGRTGHLVPPHDPAALAAAVRRCFDPDAAATFRRHIEAENEKYSWDRMVETVEKICAEVAD